MYRSLTGFYLTLACLPHFERTRQVNVHPITLSPHGTCLKNIIPIIETGFKSFMHTGMQLPLGNDNQPIMIYPFILVYTGDMPQQNDNAGFLRQNAKYGCQFCIIPKEERGNLS